MTQTTIKANEALNRWGELAFRNARTDEAVNDLLETIAGSRYDTYDELEDPIWEIIQMLTPEELDAFISGCDEIELSII